MTGPEWRVWPGLTRYPDAVEAMEARAAAIRTGTAREAIWLIEHPSLYTAGTSAQVADLLDPSRFDVFATGRGGRHTYHGPGQRLLYVMLDLDRRGRDVRHFVGMLEGWLIAALAELGVSGCTVPGRTGVWVGEAKIAAIGVRVRRWVTFHGAALNVAPELAHYAGIRPCGLDAPVTSLADLGRETTMDEADNALRSTLGTMMKNLTPGANSVQPNAVTAVSIPLEAFDDYG